MTSRICRERAPSRHVSAVDALEPRRLLSASLATNSNVGTVRGRVGFSDSLSASNTADVRKLTLAAAGSLRVVLFGMTGNADVQLVRDTNNNLRVDGGETIHTSSNPGTTSDSFTQKGLAAGTYYVRVSESGTSSINYQLSLKTDYAGNSLLIARNIGTLSAATTFKDWSGRDDSDDFYKFTFSGTKPFTATLTGLSGNLDLSLIQDKNNNSAIDAGETITTAPHPGAASETISKPLTAATYYIRVHHPTHGGGDTNYSLSLTPIGHLTVKFDYSFDASGFFKSHPAAKERLNDAAATFEILADELSAIAPGGTNTWTAVFDNPGVNGGGEIRKNNVSIAANTIVVYVGGRSDLGGLELGQGGPGGWSATGSSSWLNTVKARGQNGVGSSDFSTWGGAITFSTRTNWNFSANHPTSNQNDFLSVAIHELGHMFGIGTAGSWDAKVSAGRFNGSTVRTVDRGASPLVDRGAGHFAQNTVSSVNGVQQSASMVPALPTGSRRRFTRLDYAALIDIGWQVPAGAAATTTGSTVTTTHDPLA